MQAYILWRTTTIKLPPGYPENDISTCILADAESYTMRKRYSSVIVPRPPG